MTKIYKRLDPGIQALGAIWIQWITGLVDPGAGCDLNPVNHWIQNLGAVQNPVSDWVQGLGSVLNPVTLLINCKYNYI